jgi:hypothetical protein
MERIHRQQKSRRTVLRVRTVYRLDDSAMRVVTVVDEHGRHVEYQIRHNNEVLACATGLENILGRVSELEAEGNSI